jgi:DNA-binding XRE family transcriptional regulator
VLYYIIASVFRFTRRRFMSLDYKLIGSRIKSARKRMGMTQETLAEKIDVSVGYVSQV